MEDYIYILAGIAYLAYSFYSASKKKKENEARKAQAYESSQEEPVGNSDSDFDIEKLFGIENLKREIEDLPYEMMEVEQEQEQVFEEKQEPVIDEMKPVKMKYTEDVKPQTEVILEEESIEEQEQLDLRNAIIYSEILNPPYIQK